MKPSILIPLLLLLIAGLAFWAFRGPASAPDAVRPAPAVPERVAPAPAGPSPVAGGERLSEPAGAPALDAPPLAAPPGRPAPSVPAPDARVEIVAPEPGTWATLAVTVLDAAGAPVEKATVTLESVRASGAGQSHLIAGSPAAERTRARTDPQGEASIRYPATVFETEVVTLATFTVEHPEHLPHRARDVAVGTGRATVTIQRGAVLVVSGWIGDEANVVLDVEPLCSFETFAERTGWQRTDDGRLARIGLPPGRHALLLTHVAADGTPYSSALRGFDVFDTERSELALELTPSRTIEGRLSFDVPRPVAQGRVLVGLQTFGTRDQPRVFTARTAAIEADGTFRIEGAPPLRGEIVAACEGWVSALLPTRDLERLGVTRADDDVIAEAQRRLGARALSQQTFDASRDEGPLVLEMEPASRLVVTLEDPDGERLEGVQVSVAARVHWSVGTADSWIGALAAATDADGRASFPSLPAGTHEVRVEHADLALPIANRPNGRPDRVATVTVESGLEHEVTLRLERPE